MFLEGWGLRWGGWIPCTLMCLICSVSDGLVSRVSGFWGLVNEMVF